MRLFALTISDRLILCAQRRDTLCSGEIDRDALGDAVFSDPAARRRLNAATHLPVAVALIRRILVAWLTLKPIVVRGTPCRRVYRCNLPEEIRLFCG